MDELGKSIPAAEAFVDAESAGKGKIINEHCLNCGTKLIDTFCHHCGQKDIPRRQTLGELWINFISSFWSYEGKFFQTTKYLITRPGYLAMEYNAGRRESYFHPARMYVFISFVFFLLYFSLPDKEEGGTNTVNFKGKNKKGDTTGTAANEKKSIAPMLGPDDDRDDDDDFDETKLDSVINANVPDQDSLKIVSGFSDSVKMQVKKMKKRSKGNNWNFGLDKPEYRTLEAYDSAENAKPESKRDGWFKRIVKVRAIELNNKYKDDTNSFSKDYGNAFKDNFSKVLFWLLPFFALVLKLLYVRRGFYYSEHLVFTIYYYNFFYLAGSVQMLLNLVPGLSWLSVALGFWIYFYLLFGMKRMYQQKWGKTIVKFVIFSFAFSILALIGLSVAALAVLMTI
jgi:hypothetical protein